MGHFGFSYVGLIFLLMLTVPNLIWAERKPEGYTNRNENRILLVFERVGQVCVTCTALVFSDFNIHVWSAWSLWLIAAFVLMVMYECWWIRYFKSEKQLKNFYSSFLGVPVAGATLPVVAFFFLGLYGKVIWLMVSVVILGIGHIGIHLKHLKEIQ
ncbi:MAG: hypothetical protein GXX89_09905 [Clostridiales bacterium]|jgi:hypothetical protein|nr:hypothetical protein [Clostridiales bacterium]